MTRIPEYAVRESPKAKHAWLRISGRGGLVVVVPKGFDRKRIPRLLERKRHWLEKASKKIKLQLKFFMPEPPGELPERVVLRAIGEEWRVVYRATGAPWAATTERGENCLLVYGDIDNVRSCKEALERWLNRKTHKHLVPWLRRLAEDKGFEINRVLVKAQKTRWASCSRRATITINQKILFIPRDLVRYVFAHELCHMVHLDHSSPFWALVRKQAPDYRETHKKLRKAWRFVPAWAWVDRHAAVTGDRVQGSSASGVPGTATGVEGKTGLVSGTGTRIS